jgi:KUP system potassium uptake protein
MAGSEQSTGRRAGAASLALGALGVVFGDIGTSPLYSIQTVFSTDAARQVHVGHDQVYGVISLVFWTVTIVVTIKYVLLIMSADNEGEGGIMALIALLLRLRERVSVGNVVVLAALGIFGASLFFGDSMITPAISVLSAVEGLQVVAPSLQNLVVPITAVILVVLFSAQRLGTAAVGRMFGPVMLVWFAAIAACGVKGITQHPDVLQALLPTWGVKFLLDDGLTGFLALGGVVLAVTGAEALYADMGHFGRAPIRRAWLLVAFPALTLNYLGQGGLLVADPGGARIPMILLATAATVIASQSVISGAFSVTRQAVQLGYLPRVRIVHTSSHEVGQVYVPFVNWGLLAAVLVLVFAFQHSSKLASAYGIAVTGTFTITTLLFFVVQRARGRPLSQIVPVAGLLLFVDLLFLTSNLTKVTTGGWLPLLVGGLIYTVLATWQRGRELVTRNREAAEGPLQDFVTELREPGSLITRVPGTAVFLNRGDRTTPLAMRAIVKHTHVLHEQAVVLSIETLPVPHVPYTERLHLSELGFADDGITHVTATFGFQDKPDVTAVLRMIDAIELEGRLDVAGASYFLSKIELERTDAPGMARWRKQLFLATAAITADPVEYFVLPRERTVLVGSLIEI